MPPQLFTNAPLSFTLWPPCSVTDAFVPEPLSGSAAGGLLGEELGVGQSADGFMTPCDRRALRRTPPPPQTGSRGPRL
ncbi:hypothetical protein ANANG_G00246460 [Anguilla anguilla]|uniref:Uncharacterized protein n=1 Tax=Anguilla anguilla TaxID=7936 RepID=A0A9D3LVN1_ANGAN|nr:hypothetical protein ANANG_G00246460 [Anguilla anguilla]